MSRTVQVAEPRVGVLGFGYWGPNLVRNFAEQNALAAVCEQDPSRRKKAQSQYPHIQIFADYDDMLKSGQIDAVAIATPVEFHYTHAKAALQADKHVLVEKPLARTTRECLDLITTAKGRDRRLMAGHTFLYNAAVRKIQQMLHAGELGDLLYIYAQRLNLGIIRQDINAMWNLAPHDIAIIHHLTQKNPLRVSARGLTYLRHNLPDVVFMLLEFPNNIAAHIHISWLDPQKMRRMTIVGSDKMVVYDDVSADAKLQVYDKGVSKVSEDKGKQAPSSFGEFQLLIRSGDLLVPNIHFEEPLRGECAHFLECIKTGRRPLSDGWDGLRVVSVLEAADQSLGQGGIPVDINPSIFRNAPPIASETT